MLPSCPDAGILLKVKNVSLRPDGADTHVLHGISATFCRGRTTAVLGLSGCGKSVFLKFLAGRLNESSFGATGEVVGPDGSPVDRVALQKRISYVPADDVVNGFDTPREAIVFRHRLAFGSSSEEAEKVADALLKDLGLDQCADNLIAPGVGLRGISGGQRRRTVIAMALATAPDLLVLDEPTTGLDSSTAKSVMATVQRAARTYGCVVVQSLQQPGSDLFPHFDDVVLLNADGSLEYSGPTQNGPASIPKSKTTPVDNCPDITTKADNDAEVVGASVALTFLLLITRHMKGNLRNPLVLVLRAAQAVALGIFFGGVYLDMDRTPDNMKQVLGFTIVIALCSFVPAQTGAAVFPIEQPLFLEEAKLPYRYSAAVYGVTKTLSEFVISAPLGVVLALICGFMVGLPSTVVGNLCLTILLLNACSESVGFLMSTLLRAELSLGLGTPMAAFVTMIFGTSVANPTGATEDIFEVLRHFVFLRAGYSALSIDVIPLVEGNCTGVCLFNSGEQALTFYDLQDDKLGVQWAILAAWFIGLRLVSLGTLTIMGYNLIEKYSADKHRRAAVGPGGAGEGTRVIETTKSPLWYDAVPTGVTVAWDATFRVQRRFGDSAVRTILHGLKGTAGVGRTLAIMGGSGAGKSTLLEALTMRLPPSTSVTVVERDVDVSVQLPREKKVVSQVSQDVRALIAFVHQDNHFVSGLTVREVLEFAASTSARGPTAEGWKDVVTSVEAAMGLHHVSSLATTALSMSQRKRLAVGAALCQRRPIVVLDEPTSGLDPASALDLLSLLQELAHAHGITVLYTLHQPGDELLPHIDDLLLLSDGHVVYHGPLDEADDAFGEYPRAEGTNATDHYLELTADPEAKPHLIKAWAARTERRLQMQAQEQNESPDGKPEELKPAEAAALLDEHAELGRFGPGFVALMRRSFVVTVLRQPVVGRFIVLYLLLPVLLGVSFWDVGGDALQLQGALFTFTMGMAYCGSMGPLLDFHIERLVFLREQEAAQYPAWAYYVARSLAAMPLTVLGSLMACIVTYFMLGFYNDAGSFFAFFAAAFVVQQANIAVTDALGLLVDSLVVSVALATMAQIMFFTGCGIVVSPSRIDETGWMYILEFISPTRQAMLVMLREEMSHYSGGIDTVEQVLGYDRRHDEVDVAWPMLVGLMIVYRVVAAVLFAVTTRRAGYKRTAPKADAQQAENAEPIRNDEPGASAAEEKVQIPPPDIDAGQLQQAEDPVDAQESDAEPVAAAAHSGGPPPTAADDEEAVAPALDV